MKKTAFATVLVLLFALAPEASADNSAYSGGYPDTAVKQALSEMECDLGEDAKLSETDYIFGDRIVSVLLTAESGDKTLCRAISYDREYGRFVGLTDILSKKSDISDVEKAARAFAESNPDLAGAFGEVNTEAFLLTDDTVGICINSDCGDWIFPVKADSDLFCPAISRKSAYFPYEKIIAFTFDDGPSEYTDVILDCLEKHNCKATFFMLGVKLQGREATVKRMKSLGCELGCHGFSHGDMRRQSPQTVCSEVERTSAAIKAACGSEPTVFRAPYGEFAKSTEGVKLHRIKWSVDTLDWKKQNTAAVKDSIISGAKSGDIVLLHDIFKTSAEAFCEAVDELCDEGYRLVTVSELLELDGVKPDKTVYFRKTD